MTVICPKCDARFRDPPAEISIDRMLQCSNCEHEWVRGSQDRMIVDATPSLAPDMRDLVRNTTDSIETKLPIAIEATGPEAEGAPVYIDREPEIAKSKKANYFAAAGLAVLSLMAGVVTFQGFVVEKFPHAQSAYSAAGLQSPSPELEISNIKTTKSDKDGIRQLIIRGEIENTAAHMVPVPTLKLTMRGQQNIGLYAWTVSAAKGSLKAGERSKFTAIAHDYPGDAVDVEVEFLPHKKAKP